MYSKRDIVLAGLSAAKQNFHTPVQLQKLFFLIDRNLHEEIGGPIFDFQPYSYGPFDSAVNDTLFELQSKGLVTSRANVGWRDYALTEEGLSEGIKILSNLSSEARDYIERLSEFVRSLSFSQLVSAIYKEYPEMKVNSVFRD